MERRIIRTQDTAIEVGVLLIFLLDRTNMLVLHDLDSYDILSLFHLVGHVKDTADESTLDLAQLLAIQIDVGLPVDTIEI